MLDNILMIVLCLVVAFAAGWYGLQLDSPNTRDALKIRFRNNSEDK